MNQKVRQSTFATILLTSITLVAFAANSVICRHALAERSIDPGSFTCLRIVSGAMTLWLISVLFRRKSRPNGRILPAVFLAIYAVCFSFAYLRLSAGTGALILMGTVQATMLVGGIREGERLSGARWLGLLAALGGIVYLVSPGITAPPLISAGLMATAGVAWGIYSLFGRKSGDPITSTTDNFIKAAPMVVVASLAQLTQVSASPKGILLALISGSITSGGGYVVWYSALRGLTSTQAGVVQLAVPVIAAVGGVLLLGEPIVLRVILATVVVLGGVGVAVLRPKRTVQ